MIELRFMCRVREPLLFFFFLIIRRPPRSTLFPSPPLSRSARRRKTPARPSSPSPARWTRGPRRCRPPRRRPSRVLLAGGGTGVLRALERRALHLVRVHGGERGVVELAGADADHPLDRLDEDLAVAHFTRAGRRQDGLDARLHERLGADHLDLHLFVEFHDDGGADRKSTRLNSSH